MERSSYAPLTPSSEGPNPLRPYYRPPSLGNRSNGFDDPLASAPNKAAPSNFGSSARGILSDLNYGEILGDGGPTTADGVRALLDQAMWKYSSVFMAQPFEVAKMVLQVRLAAQLAPGTSSQGTRRQRGWQETLADGEPLEDEAEDDDDDDDDDEVSYFTSAAPSQDPTSPSTPVSARRRSGPSKPRGRAPPSPRPRPQPHAPLYKLDLRRNDSLMEVIGQLWTKEGAWGIWKGTNVTFLYSLLLKTIESWARGMFSAMVNLPDPGVVVSSTGVGGLDILDSPSPLSSLAIVVAAAGVAGLVLAPLDIVRTRVMLTSTTEPPRSIVPCLRSLRSWICPSSLVAPTLLHSALPAFLSTSTPLFLRSNLGVDPIITPFSYSVCTFLSSTVELFIKLPIETVLRRGQIQFASLPPPVKAQQRLGTTRSRSSASHSDSLPIATVVDIGPYTGVASTLWTIARQEGSSLEKTGAASKSPSGSHAHQHVYATRKGQGVQGLWRGWRVGLWGLVGVWGAAALGAGGEAKGGEF